jgi:hypothetical protein
VIAIVPTDVVAVILNPGDITTSQPAGRQPPCGLTSPAGAYGTRASRLRNEMTALRIDLRERLMRLTRLAVNLQVASCISAVPDKRRGPVQ